MRVVREAFSAARFVDDAVVANAFVAVALDAVALLEVMFPTPPFPKLKEVAERFVDDAFVAKWFVDVALVMVAFVPMRLVKVRRSVLNAAAKKDVVVALVMDALVAKREDVEPGAEDGHSPSPRGLFQP